MKIKSTSIVGESHARLEDFFIFTFNDGILKAAVGDWANNLVGGPYHYPEVLKYLGEENTAVNGGMIGSIMARETIRASELTGRELIEQINARLAGAYQELRIEGYEKHRELTFTGYIAHFIANSELMHITTVGDVRIACDGKIVAGRTKKVDEFHAEKRREYIQQTGDVAGGYDHIRPSIIQQYRYQNREGHELSYPAIDGTETLPEGIEMLTLATPKKVLLWTDGFLPPDEFTIDGLERKLKEVYSKDPHRCREYPAVGCLMDDRTALEIELDDFSRLEVLN